MRGKRGISHEIVRHRRITPADAGKTKLSLPVNVVYKDHPRGCGENGADLSHSATALGSPPRMRGKRICFSVRAQQTGITPADAGKTETNIQKTDAE